MKIKPEHLSTLSLAVAKFDTPARREAYRTGDFPRADKCADVNKRYRWDLLYVARMPLDWQDAVYAYADDTHVDTALRSIVPSL